MSETRCRMTSSEIARAREASKRQAAAAAIKVEVRWERDQMTPAECQRVDQAFDALCLRALNRLRGATA